MINIRSFSNKKRYLTWRLNKLILSLSPTYNSIDIVSPRSSSAILTSPRPSIFGEGKPSPRSGCTMAAILNSNDRVSKSYCRIGAFFDGFPPSLVVSFQEANLSFQQRDGSTRGIFVATNPLDCKREKKSGRLGLRLVWTQECPWLNLIRPCHKAAILPRGTKKALFYHAKPHPHGFHCEA